MDSIRLLTQRTPIEGHQPTLLLIDWEGCTPAQMKLLAQAHIIHIMQTQWRKGKGNIPTEWVARAADMLEPFSTYVSTGKAPPAPRPAMTKAEKILSELDQATLNGLFKQMGLL